MGKEPTKRLFAAVPLPDSIKDTLQHYTAQLRKQLSFHKWVHREDFHITLKFLGDVRQEQLEGIGPAFQKAAQELTSFSLQLNGLGSFGPPKSPSILWVGVKGELEVLQRLHQAVERAVQPYGFAPEDKTFRPHITIARKWNGGPGTRFELPSADPAWESAATGWQSDSFLLYESRLQQLPMYHALQSYPLPSQPSGQQKEPVSSS
ncbi:RNA 2',3'-cyclic phosphodiesterase [Paenibacillus turpanensis]|uniref:RNA 2',3'-cyclic phosphodiesterase n=1 Tax=Paenibacillus turpanensis TaxID=2689078 RepID=UPI00140AE74D|nr:RNA 2',3'-cyclic phosphodiesterase [Paenibacillus turpanensis]